MRLYHLPGSRSTRVLWTLEEIGAPYELTVMTGEERKAPEHRLRHPLGRVPVVELDDGRFMFESAAICLHLGDLHPDSGVLPVIGAPERPLAYQWSVFAMSELEPAVFGLLRARRAGKDEGAHRERLEPVLKALSDALGDQPWLLGETFSVADVLCGSIAGTVFRRELADGPDVLRSYAERAAQRPANVRAEAVGRTPEPA